MCKFILPKINFKIEKWKYNKEYRIFVSTLGNFKDEHKNNMPIKINSSTGYVVINTPYGIKQAHRLVMLTFKPIPNAENLTVDHKNHNKRCNELSNLEWISREENQRKAKEDLYIDATMPSIPYKNKYIIAGNLKFENMKEAIDYIEADSKRNGSTPIRGNIENRILKALNTGEKYFNVKWKTVKK